MPDSLSKSKMNDAVSLKCGSNSFGSEQEKQTPRLGFRENAKKMWKVRIQVNKHLFPLQVIETLAAQSAIPFHVRCVQNNH